jgi:hypothetical protein
MRFRASSRRLLHATSLAAMPLATERETYEYTNLFGEVVRSGPTEATE